MARPTSVRETRVSWIGPSYGFGDDLAYFRQIFGEFVRRFSATTVHVHEGYPVERYPELPLRADFAFYIRERTQQLSTGITYAARFRVPTGRTAAAILRDPADVFVVVEFSPTCLLGWALAKLRRRRVVVLVECDPAFRGARLRPLVSVAKRWIAAHSDVVLTSNEHGRRYLVDQLGVPPELVLVGPYLTSDPGLAARTAEPVPAATRLLFLNTLSRRKGISELVEALAALPAELAHRWTLTVVGSGDQEDPARALVDEHGLGDRVRFVGRVPHEQVPEFYATSDVVVCPTLGDYRSLAGIEAVNAGKAVVVSVHDGASDEIMEHAPAAWLVDPTDVESFSRTLAAVLTDPDRVASAARRPRAFSLDVVGDNLERAVERAVA